MAFIGLAINQMFSAALCGNPAAELHVTLVHLPDKAQIQAAVLCPYLERFATVFGPQQMSTRAPEVWNGKLVVRRVEGSGLRFIRLQLVNFLEATGIKYSQDYVDWNPHVTCSDAMGHEFTDGALAGHLAIHSRRLVLAGLNTITSYSWELTGAPNAEAAGEVLV